MTQVRDHHQISTEISGEYQNAMNRLTIKMPLNVDEAVEEEEGATEPSNRFPLQLNSNGI